MNNIFRFKSRLSNFFEFLVLMQTRLINLKGKKSSFQLKCFLNHVYLQNLSQIQT